MNELVQEFARAARTARDIAQLRVSLGDAARTLGFHHLLLQDAQGQAWLADMPLGWSAPAPVFDPVLTAASQCFAPFLWSDIARLVALTPEQDLMLNSMSDTGLGAAVTVPVHRPRGADAVGSYSLFAGCCSFAMKKDAALPFASLAAAHYVGALAFDAVEVLRLEGGVRRGPQLTPRQRDCVKLVAQGKSDWEAGQLLGISESTVHKHIEDAKRRFGVTTRIQLVVRSMYEPA